MVKRHEKLKMAAAISKRAVSNKSKTKYLKPEIDPELNSCHPELVSGSHT